MKTLLPIPQLYRHYKNKFYKVIGVAKHSETLEEVVTYNCLYENSSGRLWVRPKDLFFSDFEGQPRFAPVQLELQTFAQWPPELEKSLIALMDKVFPQFDGEYVLRRLKDFPQIHLQVAFWEKEIVGFKMGYEKSPECFYSWLGAVTPEWRGRGLGQALMRAQHEWAKSKGYKKIGTKTKNMWRSMLILNLREGFEIVSTAEDKKGMDIFLEKNL